MPLTKIFEYGLSAALCAVPRFTAFAGGDRREGEGDERVKPRPAERGSGPQTGKHRSPLCGAQQILGRLARCRRRIHLGREAPFDDANDRHDDDAGRGDHDPESARRCFRTADQMSDALDDKVGG